MVSSESVAPVRFIWVRYQPELTLPDPFRDQIRFFFFFLLGGGGQGPKPNCSVDFDGFGGFMVSMESVAPVRFIWVRYQPELTLPDPIRDRIRVFRLEFRLSEP